MTYPMLVALVGAAALTLGGASAAVANGSDTPAGPPHLGRTRIQQHLRRIGPVNRDKSDVD